MEENLEKIFKRLNFIPSLSGYDYLKEAIRLKINGNYTLQVIYHLIAKKYDTTYTAVERGIRTLYSHNKELINRVFNINCSITNSTLIGLIVRELKYNNDKIEPLEFEKVIKNLDKNKYHICRSMIIDLEKGPYIDEWSIFRKDMSVEEYFSPNNLAILSSKNGNTLDDIKKLVEEF